MLCFKRSTICDRVCIKGPLVGNLKNEIIKFYDKLGFKVLFPLFSLRNLVFAVLKSIFPAESRDVKITKFEKWLPEVSAVGFYNPACILVNLSKIFGGMIPTYLSFTNLLYLIKNTKFKLNLCYKLCNSDK